MDLEGLGQFGEGLGLLGGLQGDLGLEGGMSLLLVWAMTHLGMEQRPSISLTSRAVQFHGSTSHRDSSGYSIEPGTDCIASSDRAGLAHQDQEGGLEGILSRVWVRQGGSADIPDHWSVERTKAANAASASISSRRERNRSSSRPSAIAPADPVLYGIGIDCADPVLYGIGIDLSLIDPATQWSCVRPSRTSSPCP